MPETLIRSRPGRGHEFSSSESKRPRKPFANAAILLPLLLSKEICCILDDECNNVQPT
ncbi:hypothetical protein K0M31_012199, partial [Melipona bicolor]